MPIAEMKERPKSRKWHDSDRDGLGWLLCSDIHATSTGQVTGQVTEQGRIMKDEDATYVMMSRARQLGFVLCGWFWLGQRRVTIKSFALEHVIANHAK